MSTVRDKDNGAKALAAALESLKGSSVSVGVFDTEGSKEHGPGVTILDVATFHEFGLGVPERSFIRAWVAENETQAREAMRKIIESVAKGKRSKDQALEAFGTWVQGQIQKRIATNIPPPLDPKTIERKGSSVALIDTGQLRSSITFKVGKP